MMAMAPTHVIVHLRDSAVIHLSDEGNGPCGVTHDCDQLKLQTVLAAVATLFDQGLVTMMSDGHTDPGPEPNGRGWSWLITGRRRHAPRLALIPAAVAMLHWISETRPMTHLSAVLARPSKRQNSRIILIAITNTMVLLVLDSNIVGVMLPSMRRDSICPPGRKPESSPPTCWRWPPYCRWAANWRRPSDRSVCSWPA